VLNVPALTLRFRSRYPAVARSVRAIRSDVLDTALDCGADGECLEEIRVAVSEAAREAVSRNRADAHVRVQIELGDGELVVTVGGDGLDHADTRMRFPCALAVDEEHDRAVEQLEEALVEQDRLSDRLDAAVGTSTELTAYAQLQAAGSQVAARQAWLHWVDDEAYRGLNAGDFELRASDSALAGLPRRTPA
jgi:anti-sigma regulatory factor (Ser/Thr protein kinase)